MLPNVITTVIVFFPLMIALNMLTESALSFLSIGVQPPDASWGTIISDGQGLLYTRPWVAIAPGLAIVATVLCLNVLGDGVRDALDPRARLRVRQPVIAFIIRRVVATLFVMFALSVLVFLIFFATPGVDPAARIAGRNADPETLKQVRHDFGLDRPLPVQYVLMMKKLFITRDLTSFVNRGAKVIPQIVDAAPVTFSLVFGAAIIWVVVAIAMGAGGGRHARDVRRSPAHDPRADRHLDAGLLAGRGRQPHHAEPPSRPAVLVVAATRVHALHAGPVGMVHAPDLPLAHALGGYIGFYGRVLRSSLIDGENEDFVRTARAKGLTERRVLIRHVLRTSMITFVSLFGLDFGAIVAGGALLTEVVFGLPGIGKLTYDSLQNLDLPVIIATVIYAAFFIVLANAIVDIVYGLLDPRVRVE